MNRAVTAFLITAVLCAVGVGVYAMAPVPSEDLNQLVPKPATLASFVSTGCGVSDLSRASVTQIYKGPIDSPENLRSLETELAAEGFAKSSDASGIHFRKAYNDFMPVLASVVIRPNGEAICSARRSKWGRP